MKMVINVIVILVFFFRAVVDAGCLEEDGGEPSRSQDQGSLENSTLIHSQSFCLSHSYSMLYYNISVVLNRSHYSNVDNSNRIAFTLARFTKC